MTCERRDNAIAYVQSIVDQYKIAKDAGYVEMASSLMLQGLTAMEMYQRMTGIKLEIAEWKVKEV